MTQPAGGRTREKLEAKTSEERFRVWSNARAKGPLEAEELARFIEESGLNYAPFGGVSMSDPRVLEMRAVIETQRARMIFHEKISKRRRQRPSKISML